MKNIFTTSEEEKNRIRNLHEEESKNKKIDSSLLNEQPVGVCGCGAGASQNIPQGGTVRWHDKCPGSPNLLNPLPCATINGQMPDSSHVGKYVSLGNTGFCAKVREVSTHSLPSGSVACPPTPLTLGTDCNNCDSTSGGDTSYRCHNNQCVAIAGLGGQYATLQDCLDDGCEEIEPETWNCTQAGLCISVPNTMGQYPTEQDCLQNCEQPTYNCKWVSGDPNDASAKVKPISVGGKGRENLQEQVPVSGYQCVIHQGAGTGQYPNLPACQAVCGDEVERNYCVNCSGQTMSYYPNPSLPGVTSCPQGFVDIGTNPSPPQGPCVECQNNNCNQGNGWMGQHNSMADCQAVCIQQNDWECTSPGTCNQTAAGTFPTQAACMASPGCQGPMDWECDMTNGCSQTAAGTHPSQSACETACCNDVITNWGWAQGTQTNPCQKFYNMFGPMGTVNPSTLPFNEECIYNYLMNLILNLGGPCVSGNFITLLNNFMSGNNQCYGNPGSGGVQGNPAQNSVCGKVDQFCPAPVGSFTGTITPGKFFKCQYAISFAASNGCTC